MKKIILSIIALFFVQKGFSQDIEKCRELVQLTKQGINQKTAELLLNHLAANFSIAAKKGAEAKAVLQQLLAKTINDRVLSTTEMSSEKKNNSLTLTYTFDYEKTGSNTTTFVFNQNNELEKLKLIAYETTVLGVDSSLGEAFYPDKNFIEIPFNVIHDLIFVEVLLNNKKRTFILDSGAPTIILNSKYLNPPNTSNSDNDMMISAYGAGGEISGVSLQRVKSINFAGISMDNQQVITMDLSHLEKSITNKTKQNKKKETATELELHGLIGYDLIKPYDVLYDYKNKTLTLITPDFYETYLKAHWPNAKTTTIPFKMSQHMPMVATEIGSENYNLEIDSGATANLLSLDILPIVKQHLKKQKTDTLKGADKHSKQVASGKLKKMWIGSKKFKNTPTIFSDISHLKDTKDLTVHGVIGYHVLSKQKTLISYARKTLTFIE